MVRIAELTFSARGGGTTAQQQFRRQEGLPTTGLFKVRTSLENVVPTKRKFLMEAGFKFLGTITFEEAAGPSPELEERQAESLQRQIFGEPEKVVEPTPTPTPTPEERIIKPTPTISREVAESILRGETPVPTGTKLEPPTKEFELVPFVKEQPPSTFLPAEVSFPKEEKTPFFKKTVTVRFEEFIPTLKEVETAFFSRERLTPIPQPEIVERVQTRSTEIIDKVIDDLSSERTKIARIVNNIETTALTGTPLILTSFGLGAVSGTVGIGRAIVSPIETTKELGTAILQPRKTLTEFGTAAARDPFGTAGCSSFKL